MSSAQVPVQMPQNGTLSLGTSNVAAAGPGVPNLNYSTQVSATNMQTVPTYSAISSLPQPTGIVFLHIFISIDTSYHYPLIVVGFSHFFTYDV